LLTVSLGDLLLKEKKPLFCVAFTASFIIYMIALVSYYCFASASDKGAEINAFGFICLDAGLIPGRSTFFQLIFFPLRISI